MKCFFKYLNLIIFSLVFRSFRLFSVNCSRFFHHESWQHCSRITRTLAREHRNQLHGWFSLFLICRHCCIKAKVGLNLRNIFLFILFSSSFFIPAQYWFSLRPHNPKGRWVPSDREVVLEWSMWYSPCKWIIPGITQKTKYIFNITYKDPCQKDIYLDNQATSWSIIYSSIHFKQNLCFANVCPFFTNLHINHWILNDENSI